MLLLHLQDLQVAEVGVGVSSPKIYSGGVPPKIPRTKKEVIEKTKEKERQIKKSSKNCP